MSDNKDILDYRVVGLDRFYWAHNFTAFCFIVLIISQPFVLTLCECGRI